MEEEMEQTMEQTMEQSPEAETPAQDYARMAQQAWEEADRPLYETAETEPRPEEPEGVELKYMGETRRVAREEAVALAQKGMDYDRIRNERDELRDYRLQALPALELVERMARGAGMSTEAYLEACRKRLPAGEEKGGGADWSERARKDRLDREMRDFIAQYPQVKPAAMPKEVWQMVAAGRSLTGAYDAYRIRTLEAELAKRDQAERNRQRSLGSMSESAPGGSYDQIARWWNED